MKTQKIKLSSDHVKELTEYKKSKDCVTAESNRIQAILMVNRQIEPDFIEEITGYNKKARLL